LDFAFGVWRLAFGVCLKEVSSMKQQIHALANREKMNEK
jgi:hypothetical protein